MTFDLSVRSSASSRISITVPAAAVILIAGAASLWGQSDRPTQIARPAFDVASVKQNMSGDSAGSFATSPIGYTIRNYSLLRLISSTYQVQEFQVVGGPNWMNTDRFDVIAKAAAGSHPTRGELTQMLQSLLADRFNLDARLETRIGPTYSLVLARSDGAFGQGFRPSGVDCATAATSIRRDPEKCGMRFEAEAVHVRGMVLAVLVEYLKSAVRRPVFDRTGLTGGFDYDLKFNRSGSADSTAPSIFAALQEQLGLKLASEQGPVEMLVIARADHPTPD